MVIPRRESPCSAKQGWPLREDDKAHQNGSPAPWAHNGNANKTCPSALKPSHKPRWSPKQGAPRASKSASACSCGYRCPSTRSSVYMMQAPKGASRSKMQLKRANTPIRASLPSTPACPSVHPPWASQQTQSPPRPCLSSSVRKRRLPSQRTAGRRS